MTRAEGRRESASDQIDLLRGAGGAATRLVLELLRKTRLLWRLNGTIRGSWLGQPVRIPLIFGNGIQHVRASERWLYDLLRALLASHSGAFVDVGANIGQTLLKVKMVDRSRPYFGFEPNPASVAYLQQLIASNRFNRTHVFPIGLSDRAGVVPLWSRADVDPSSSLVEGFRAAERYSSSQAVAIVRGDDVLGNVRDLRIGTVKIDVEGGELDVLAGLEQTIARDRPSVVCEVLPVYDPDSATGQLRLSRQRALRALLSRLSYRVYRAAADHQFEEVGDFPIDADLTRSNYLFLPHERLAVVFLGAHKS